jgi:UbiD family decarboxylase
VRIKCITHQHNPIFRGTAWKSRNRTEPVSWLAVVTQIAQVYKAVDLPELLPSVVAGAPRIFAIVAKKSYSSQGLDAGDLLSSKPGKIMKHVIVVDADVNILT